VSSIADSVLHLHGVLALAIVFGLPLLESALFVGFVFPGETAAILAGVLAYEHRLNLTAAIVAVILGAIIGDSIGYEVGRKWGTWLLEGPLSRWVKAEHVARAEDLLRRYGGWAVFLGRFTAVLRVMIPGIAGTGRMPYRRFVVFNVTGGILWGTAFVVLGYLAGVSWHTVASTAGTAGLVAGAVVVVAIVVVMLVRRRRRGSGVTVAQQQAADHQQDGDHQA
jgi:undecaprenyl-diphosphatase